MDTHETTARAQSQLRFRSGFKLISEEAAEKNFILGRVLKDVWLSLKY